jgi:hypothetical protein
MYGNKQIETVAQPVDMTPKDEAKQKKNENTHEVEKEYR